MKRRDVLRSLAGAAGIGGATAVRAGMAAPLSTEGVAALMRMHGLEPRPGEAAQVQMFLWSTRWRASTIPDPRIEPSIRLDPRVD